MRFVAACAAAAAFQLSSPALRHAPAAAPRLAMNGDGALDGWGGSTDGNTFFTTWDGRDEDGVSPEGMLPPGEDLIESDLRRLFDVESDDADISQSTELDDLALMYKLRKELGDADFARIFEDPRVKGPNF